MKKLATFWSLCIGLSVGVIIKWLIDSWLYKTIENDIGWLIFGVAIFFLGVFLFFKNRKKSDCDKEKRK